MHSTNVYSTTILETHLDTFGHVNNATYLTLYEEARWELITKKGYGLQEIHALQQGPVILEVNLKFLQELRLREVIHIHTKVLDYSKKIGRLEQKIQLSNGTVANEALFTFGLFDLKARKLIAPTPAWLAAIS